MRAGSFAWVLLLSAALAGAAWFFLGREAAPLEEGRLLFPDLRAVLTGAREIETTTHDQSFTLELGESGGWEVRERRGYPAQAGAVRRFLLGAAGLQIRSRKTSNPDFFAKLDLNDPSEEDSRAVRVVIRNEEGGELASFVAGKVRPASEVANPDPDRGESQLRSLNHVFVRLPDDTVWLVEGALEIAREPADYLRREGLADIPRDTIRSVRVAHPGGGRITISRPAQGEDFVLQKIPGGRSLRSQSQLDDLVALFVDLSFEDVTAADEVKWGGVRATMTAFDKMKVVLEQGEGGGESWIRLSAEAPAGAAEDSTQFARAAELNQRWQGWAYRLSAARMEILRRKMQALVE